MTDIDAMANIVGRNHSYPPSPQYSVSESAAALLTLARPNKTSTTLGRQHMGWGNQTVLVDTEMAAARPVQEEWVPDYSNLPENSIVHLVVSEDDMTVGQCNSVHQHALFEEVDENQTLLLYIPSDRYGFPRLVATHYIPANEAHDTLADWAFYRRIDAQADWVVAQSRGDLNTADFAYANLVNVGMLTNLGKWSNGVDVLPIQAYTNPSDSKQFADCFDGE